MTAFRSRIGLLLLLLVVALTFACTVNADAAAAADPAVKVDVATDTKPSETTECLAQQTELDEHKQVLESTKEDHGKLLTEVTIMRDEYATLVSKLTEERTKTKTLSGELEAFKELAQAGDKESDSKLTAAKSECEGKLNAMRDEMAVCEKAKAEAPSVERQDELEASVKGLKEEIKSMKASVTSDTESYVAAQAKLKKELEEYKKKFGGKVEDLLKELEFHRQGVHVVAWERFKVKYGEAEEVVKEYAAIGLERAQFYGGEAYEKASFYGGDAMEKATVYGGKAAEASKEYTAVLRTKTGEFADVINTFNQDVVQPKYTTLKRSLEDTYTSQVKPAFDTAYDKYVPQVVEATEPHWKRAQDLYERKVRTQFDVVAVVTEKCGDATDKASIYYERAVNSINAARARAITNLAKVADSSAEDAEWAVDWIAFVVLFLIALLVYRKVIWLSWRLTVLTIKVGLLFSVVVGCVLVYDKATGYKL